MYIDTGSPVPSFPSKSRGLAAENKKKIWLNGNDSKQEYYRFIQKIAIPTVLHRTELWNNITKKDLNTIQPFQHFIAKHIQNFNKRTRSDICETIFHLLRLPTLVDKRNFMVFTETIRLWSLFTFKTNIFIPFLQIPQRQQFGFIPDIVKILGKYELLPYVMNYDFLAYFRINRRGWKR